MVPPFLTGFFKKIDEVLTGGYTSHTPGGYQNLLQIPERKKFSKNRKEGKHHGQISDTRTH